MLFHAPYTSIDFLSMIWLVGTVPVFLFLPPVDSLLGYSRLSAIVWSFINVVALVAVPMVRSVNCSIKEVVAEVPKLWEVSLVSPML